MRIYSIFAVLLFLISSIVTKPVTFISLEDFFKEWPIESSTEKHYFRTIAWTGGGMIFAFKVYKPHPEFEIDFKINRIQANSTDDEMVNAEKWTSWASFSERYSGDDYDLYYYNNNYEIGCTDHVGIYFSSSQEYKMTFKVRGIGYYFPLSDTKETIVDDYDFSHYFQCNFTEDENRDKDKYMSFVLKVYKPMEVFDFTPSGWCDEIDGKSSEKLKFGSVRIKEGNDYMMFSYPFILYKNIKRITIHLSSSEHYKIGCYLVFRDLGN